MNDSAREIISSKKYADMRDGKDVFDCLKRQQVLRENKIGSLKSTMIIHMIQNENIIF